MLGHYVQFIKKDHAFDYINVPDNNFNEIDNIIERQNLQKLAFPNYILKKIIINATELKIRVNSIEFYGDIPPELQELVDEKIEQRNYKELLEVINENKLSVRKVVFYDIKNKIYSSIFSNGIGWTEDNKIITSVVNYVLSQ